MASESIMAMVVTTYNVNDTDNEENLISSTKADTMTFSVNGVSFNMVKVDGGVFKMGGTEEQGDEVEENELPIHNVTVASFLIGQTEVTQDLWESVMGSNPSDNKHRY
ncbi:MAG: SUMF1/EgtB/PvdO family nonheme iron enzyme, partial [Muribaculaceae bacterium]|nr:SUMF1/EgtB/PvdO family nonheme iron enzyme [Muribaculaceae bacterium]